MLYVISNAKKAGGNSIIFLLEHQYHNKEAHKDVLDPDAGHAMYRKSRDVVIPTDKKRTKLQCSTSYLSS